ncbi:hypothetical protein F5888DRAFT_1712710 [Russula emetica]|nr:hypothetical protein F5888DRAFT_1712710 [Russula emetica]
MVQHEPNTVIFFIPVQRFVGCQSVGGKCSSMARNAVSRQGTGSNPNSGAVALFNLAYLLCSEMPPSPILSKVSLMGLSHTTLGVLGRTVFLESASYHEAKQAATTYQAAKQCLIGPNAPFAGWVVSGEEWESFDAHGELRSERPRLDSTTRAGHSKST